MATPTKSARRNLRVSPTDDSLVSRAAEAVGESVSEFFVESARARAELVLADRREFTLDADAWEIFTAALDRPAEVNPAVVDVMRRPRPA
jgi:uncharacterized protein (DUF1778 family)